MAIPPTTAELDLIDALRNLEGPRSRRAVSVVEPDFDQWPPGTVPRSQWPGLPPFRAQMPSVLFGTGKPATIRLFPTGKPISLSKGEVLMIPAWQGFSLEIGEDSRLIEIACGLHPFAVIDHRSDISHVSVARFDDNKGTAPAIRQVVEALRGGTPKGGLSDSLLRGLPRAAADAILASASADKIKHARKRGIELAEQTLLFADRNVQRPIQRESLAEAAGISESYVTMLARLQLGLNASDLIRQRRVLAASRLLAHTDLPISDIAWICGFSSSSFFIRTFKQLKGITPRRHRTTAHLPEKSEPIWQRIHFFDNYATIQPERRVPTKIRPISPEARRLQLRVVNASGEDLALSRMKMDGTPEPFGWVPRGHTGEYRAWAGSCWMVTKRRGEGKTTVFHMPDENASYLHGPNRL